jgi:osmotically-inducible protein OsmY
MTRRLLTTILVLALAGYAFSQGASGQQQDTTRTPASAQVDDPSLHRQVSEQLANNASLRDVKVRIDNGVVYLEGSVPKGEDRQSAKDVAQSVPGVKSVVDNLTVSPSAMSPGSSTPSAQGENAQSSTTQTQTGGVTGTTSTTTTTTQTTTTTPAAGASSSGTAAASGAATEQQRYVGCLQQPAAGAWVLTASDGTQYLLRGVNTDLSGHRGHTVAVFGSPEPASQAAPSGSSSSVESTKGTGSQVGMGADSSGAGPTPLTVNRIEHVADKCEPATPSGAAASSGASGTTTTGSAGAQATTGTTGSIGSSASPAPASGGTATETATAGGTFGTAASSSDLKAQIENALHNEPTLASSTLVVNVTEDSIELSGRVPNSRNRETALRIARSYAGNRRVIDRLKTAASTTGQPGTTAQPSTNSDTGNAPTQHPRTQEKESTIQR